MRTLVPRIDGAAIALPAQDLIVDAPMSTGAVVGGAVQLWDRSYFTAGSNVNPAAADFSLSLWFYADNLDASRSLFCTGATTNGEDGFHLYVDTAGALQLCLNDSVQANRLTGALSANGAIVATKWSNLIVTFDRDGNATAYLNGAATGTTVAISSHAAALGATRTRLGNDGSSMYHIGGLSDVFYWTRLLTAAEISWLYQLGNPRGYSEFGTEGSDGGALLTSVVHGWPFHDISGTREDVVGTNDLSESFDNLVDNPGFETRTGRTWKSFKRADKACFSVPNNAALQVGDIDFTLTASVKFNAASMGVYTDIVVKRVSGVDYYLQKDFENKIAFGFYNGGWKQVLSASISVDTTYHIIAWHDAAADKLYVSLNNAAAAEAATGGVAPPNGTETLFIGGEPPSATYVDGTISQVGLWKRALTEAERTSIYNVGLGKYYNELTNAEKVSCTAFWDCTDPTGTTLTDMVGSNDGTFTAANLLTNPGFETRTGRTWKSFVATDKACYSIPDNAALDLGTGDIYLTASVTLTSLPAAAGIILAKHQDGSNTWALYFDSSGVLHFDAIAGGAVKVALATTPTYSVDTPYDIAVLIDRSNSANNRIYVNGESQALATSTSSADDVSNTGAVTIGQYGNGTFYFDGKISQVGIGKPPDAAEAATQTAASTTNYNAGLGLYYAEIASGDRTKLGITAYWDCTDPTGTTLTDMVGSSHGTLLAGPLVTNGAFASNITGWTNYPTYPWETCEWDGVGQLHLAGTGDNDPPYSVVYQSVPFTAGRRYNLSYTATRTSGDAMVLVGDVPINQGCGYVYQLTFTETVSTSFTATSGAAIFQIYCYNTIARDWLFDNIDITAASILTVNDNDAFGTWTELQGLGDTLQHETVTPLAGAISFRHYKTAAGGASYVYQTSVGTLGRAYTLSARAKADSTSGTPTLLVMLGNQYTLHNLTTSEATYTKSTTSLASATTVFLGLWDGTGRTAYIDTVSLVATNIPTVSDADLFGSWTEVNSNGCKNEHETVAPLAGAVSARAYQSGSPGFHILIQEAGVLGRTYLLSVSAKADSTDGSPVLNIQLGYSLGAAHNLTTSLATYTLSGTMTAVAGVYLLLYTGTGRTAYIDTVSLVATSIPTVSDANLFGSWTEATAGSTVIHTGTIGVNAGGDSCRFDADSSGSEGSVTQAVLTAGRTYTATVSAKVSDASGANELQTRLGSGATQNNTLTTSFAAYTHSATCAGSTSLVLASAVTSKQVTIDTVSVVGTSIPTINGPTEAMASDSSAAGHHGQLLGLSVAQHATAWTRQIVDGSYTAAVKDGKSTNDGTMIGFADPAAARTNDVDLLCSVSQALVFDGVDDKVLVPNNAALDLTPDLTICAWIKPGTIGDTWRTIISKRPAEDAANYELGLAATTGRLLWYSSGMPSVSTYAPTVGQWTHVAAVVSGTTVTLYANGVLVHTVLMWQAVATNAGSLGIGSAGDASGSPFIGSIADARVYGSTLTVNNLLHIATAGASGTAPGDPVGSWIGYDPARSVLDVAGGTGLALDGTDDYITVPDAADLRFDAGTLSFSFAAWVQTTTKAKPILEKRDGDNDGYILTTTSDGYLFFSLDTIDITGNTNICDGAWHHVGVSITRGEHGRLYLDGVLNSDAVVERGEAMATTAALLFGKESVGNTFWNGTLDDVRAYSVALATNNFAALAAGDPDAANYPSAANLVAHWGLDDGEQGGLVTGDPVYALVSSTGGWKFAQGTISKRPLFDSAGLNNRACIVFNGSSKLMLCTQVNQATQQGALCWAIQPASVSASMALLALGDTGAANQYFLVGIYVADGTAYAWISHNNAGVINEVRCTTPLVAGTRYIIQPWSNGATWGIDLDGIAETLVVITGANTGAWFGDVPSANHWSLGALSVNADSLFYDGKLGHFAIYSTATNVSARRNAYRYLNKLYGKGA